MSSDPQAPQDDYGSFVMHGYQFIRQIGEGSFAKVFEVSSLKYRTTFCAKVMEIDRSLIDESGSLNDPELMILRNLDHPNVIRIYDCFVCEDYLFLIFEMCNGGSLANIMERRRLSHPEVLRWFREVVNALAVCHSQGIAHRDIKPDNIFIDAYNRAKVADFGLSTMLAKGQKMCAGACGSPNYVAPEMLTQPDYDPFKADVWSLGVTVYQMATGTLPWNESVTLNSAERPPVVFPRTLDAEMVRVLEKMLCLDPEKRVSMKELSDDRIFIRSTLNSLRRKSGSTATSRMSRTLVSGQLLGLTPERKMSASLSQQQLSKFVTFSTSGSQIDIPTGTCL